VAISDDAVMAVGIERVEGDIADNADIGITAGMPRAFASPTAAGSRSTVYRTTPGMVGMASVSPLPLRTNTGQIKSSGLR
jgi:hypothetical protein